MPIYFDTSAIVPILIAERGSERCRGLWNSADIIVTCAITYVEVHAALAAATRHGRLDATEHGGARERFEELCTDMVRVPVTDTLIRAAATLASRFALRGYDALHCATALAAASDDFTAASGDRDLLRAWSNLGLHTVDTSA